jgi:hypothetical protein
MWSQTLWISNVVFSILYLLPPRPASAQCNSNFSADYILYDANLEVNIDLGTWPVDFNQMFYEGLLAAKNALPPGSGVTVSRNSGGIPVYFDNDLLNKVPFTWAETDMTTYIRINPQAMSYSTNISERLFTRLGAHEGIHMLWRGVVWERHSAQ